jgi:hypothetical protein
MKAANYKETSRPQSKVISKIKPCASGRNQPQKAAPQFETVNRLDKRRQKVAAQNLPVNFQKAKSGKSVGTLWAVAHGGW